MISISRNRILIKLFYDLNPRMAANVLPAAGQCLLGWLARPRHGIGIESRLGVDGPECETGSRVPDAEFWLVTLSRHRQTSSVTDGPKPCGFGLGPSHL